MQNPIIKVFRKNAEVIKLTIIDPDTNKGKDITASTIYFRVYSDLNPASTVSYLVNKAATITSATEGECEVTLLNTDFTTAGVDYYYGVFIDGVMVCQGDFIVKDSIII